MSWDFMLLAAQGAGYATSVYARKQQERFYRMGEQLDRQQLDLQMQQESLASNEQSYANTEKLRDVMATQRALFASRGQQSGQGSNLFIGQKAQGSYNAEEKARQLSLSFRKHQMESMQKLMGLNRTSRNTERRMGNIGKAFDIMSFNALSDTLGGSNSPYKLSNIKVPKFFGG